MIRRTIDDHSYTDTDSEVLSNERKHIGVEEPSCGLALSGGGIRSAAFSLGVLQALAKARMLSLFDYMSTVSGGGYIGCSLTWWLSLDLPKGGGKSGTDPENFPFSMDTKNGKSIVDFLRLHGNYLLPDAQLNLTSIFAVVLRNVVVAFLVYFVGFTLVIFFIEFLFGLAVNRYEPLTQWVWAFLDGAFTAIAVLPGSEEVPNGFRGLWEHVIYLVKERSWFTVLLITYMVAFVVGILRSTSNSPLWQVYRLALFVIALILLPTQKIANIMFGWLYELPAVQNTELMLLKFVISAFVYLAIAFVLGSLFYSSLTLYYQWIRRIRLKSTPEDIVSAWNYRRYDERTFAQKIFGKVLTLLVVMMTVSIMGILQESIIDTTSIWINACAIIIPIIGLALAFSRVGIEYFTLKNQRILPVGAWLFIYGSILWSFVLVNMVESYLRNTYFVDAGLDKILLFFGVLFLIVALWFLIGFCVNVNYFGLHRMYRDRLMELFLPDKEAVETMVRRYANNADTTTLASICESPCKRPYHLINTNVVLVDSSTTKYRSRGGDNFIMSPLYCGSSATGWRRSKNYLTDLDPGVTLATAMAISGAAASPNAGRYGLTRERSNSLLMSVLGLRLGYWAPNPNPDNSSNRPPNFVFPGIAWVVLGSLKEDRKVMDLTDGGHFENLGLYELIRRKLAFIVVCDSSADLDSRFRDLAVAINRVKVDFGVSIRFSTEENEPKNVDTAEGVTSQLRNELSAHGFASAEILYEDQTKGQLIYLKPILRKDLSIEIYSYKARHADFPHETTYDQFFDEDQFEAYRELGFHLGNQFTEQVMDKPEKFPGLRMEGSPSGQYKDSEAST